MKFPCVIVSNSEAETNTAAKEFSSVLKEGDLILLNGNLGSGKTFFVKCVCEVFGIKNASSPTFAIVNEYNGAKIIRHFDFYRIRKVSELNNIGFADYLLNGAITFIEWANLFPEILPHKYFIIDFEYVNESTRNMKFAYNE